MHDDDCALDIVFAPAASSWETLMCPLRTISLSKCPWGRMSLAPTLSAARWGVSPLQLVLQLGSLSDYTPDASVLGLKDLLSHIAG